MSEETDKTNKTDKTETAGQDVNAAAPTPQPDEASASLRHPDPENDVRGKTTTDKDQSSHRRYTWLYEDLLA